VKRSTDTAGLYAQMKWLSGCLVNAKGQLPKAIEVVWQLFHCALSEKVPQSTCRMGFSFMALKCMQRLVELNFRLPKTLASANDELDEKDKDILLYISGFLLQKTRKDHRLCEDFVDTNSSPTGMVKIFDRGGLLMPRPDFLEFVFLLEAAFRLLAPCSVDKNQFFVNVDSSGGFMVFQGLIGPESSDIPCYETQETCFLCISNLFFKVRAHQKCRKLFDDCVKNTSKIKKSKAVRDVLSK